MIAGVFNRARRRGLAVVAAAFALPCGAGDAAEIVTLAGDQAAIVFIVSGRGITGDIQVRESKTGKALWDALLAPASVRQFTVRPGDYTILLEQGAAPVSIAVQSGHAILLTLSGVPGNGVYRLTNRHDAKASEIGGTALPAFIDENGIAPADYAPVTLEHSGPGLTFLFRVDN